MTNNKEQVLKLIRSRQADKYAIIDAAYAVYTNAYLNSKLSDDVKVLCYKIKREGDNKGQFGYYITRRISSIVKILNRYNLTSFVDLGCGSGHLVKFLHHTLNYKTKGVEIEQTLVNDAQSCLIQQGDILDPNLDIKKFEAIYFWEPFENRKLAEKFVDNLEEITHKGQYIIYLCSGTIGLHLNNSNKFRKLQSEEGFQVFKVQ